MHFWRSSLYTTYISYSYILWHSKADTKEGSKEGGAIREGGGGTYCNLYDIHNDILRTNERRDAEGGRKGSKVEGIYKEWPGRAGQGG